MENNMDDSSKPESNVAPVDGVVTDKTKAGYSDIAAALFNGMGVGLLLGLLLGLAVSPVVSAFIGSISSILILLIGLKENYFNVVKSVRIGAFGVFAVAGILAGFYIRSHSPLAPSLSDLKEEYISLGYNDTVAKEILLFQEFGLVPESWVGRLVAPRFSKSDSAAAVMAQNVRVSKMNNVLFSSTVDVGACDMLEYSNSEMSFDQLKKNFKIAKGTWKELAENIDTGMPDQVKVNTLLIIRDVFCNSGNSGTTKINCIKFQQPVAEMSVDELTAALKKADPLWEQIITSIDASIDKQYHQKLYLSLINTFCHD